jgi:hypothetical protein
MAAISQKLPNLIGGVSQQPDAFKSPNQLRECINYYPDPTFGLAKRPGLRGISKLANAASDGTWFSIFRDEEEKYIAQFTKQGVLRIWDANSGVQQTVNTPASSATAYATHTDSTDLTILQINDYNFVLNRTVTVQENVGDVSPTINPFGFVVLNSVAYDTTYTITIAGTAFSYSSPTTSGSSLNASTIVNALVSSINGNPAFVATAIGNSIHIRRANNADFSLEASGGVAGNAIQSYKGTVSTVSELPRQFLNGSIVKILASEDSNGDDYYAKFVTSDGGASGTGVWEETLGPGVIETIDESTMPHVIIREANGTFTFRELDATSAGSTPTTATVTGVPSAVTILTSGNGRYAVGQSFPVYGGTGLNLRLKVTATRTDTVNNDFPWSVSSTSYVERIVYTNGSQLVKWYSNGTVFQTTATDSSFTLGNITFSRLGSYTNVAPSDPSIVIQQQAGLRATTVVSGIIDGVTISRAGRNYTALDVVTNAEGDTFRIDTVASVTQSVDAVGKLFWQPRVVGDEITNPMPTFVGNRIHGISFFKNRLILMSNENVICSQAGDYFNFFASTVITIVDSDPIDLSCGSLKPIELRHAVQVPRGLALFADNAQYILETTTDAFSASTAEINLLSSFSQSPRISPVDTGSSIAFVEQSDTATGVFEMSIGSPGEKPTTVELTRGIPSYIPSDIKELKATSSASSVALLSNRELKSLYIFRFFEDGTKRLMFSWFKWEMPGPLVMIEFDHDTLFVITKHNSSHVLSKVNLLTDTPGGALFFDDKYIDLRLDLFDYNPKKVYDAVADETHICFKDGFEETNLQPVLVSLNPLEPGVVQELSLVTDLLQPVGEQHFVVVPGDQTTSQFALGYKYEASATLPAFYYVISEGRKDTLNIPMIHRMAIDSYNSGPYGVKVRAQGRNEFATTLPQIVGNLYQSNTIPMLRNAKNTVPVLAKGDQVEVELLADSPFPTAITSITWEGTFNNKGISIK